VPLEKTSSLPDEHERIGEGPEFEVSKVDERERLLGRYELIYEIGHGGMANVFLARSSGPAGFQKWFAIKRVHEQLAKDEAFVNMFLDEARIAAAIQHPNVAQVFDLGEAGGHYFLAMEYLHGEPLTALATRCAVSMGQVPAGIAAYIVARAADGLHHAHEATDTSGASMNLVHRDVSPHNVFVTYDGQVKLTDFGVAKAAGRITHTETGVVKGKLAYASPEQLRGAELDRRSDIFALGIVLWEISTGRRLFRASNDAETLHRIYSGYRLSPTSLVSGFPTALEAIIDRALAHDLEDRYATAAELSRDLDRFLATSELTSGSAAVATTMRANFADQIKAKDLILHQDRNARTEPPPPASRQEEPSHSEMRRSAAATEVSRTVTSVPGLASGNGKLTKIALGLLALLTVAGVAYWQLAMPKTSQVRFDSQPGGATLRIDGQAIPGATPILAEAVSEGRHHVELTLEGYDPFEATFDARGDRVELHYALTVASPTERQPVAGGPSERPDDGTDTSAAGSNTTALTGTETGTGTTGTGTNGAGTNGAGTTGAGTTDGVPARGTDPDPPAGVSTGDTADDDGPAAPSPRTRRRRPRAQTRPPTAAREPATLTLIARPWAHAWINGEDVGNTPIFRRSVPSGVIRVRLQPEGVGASRSFTYRAEPGQSISRNVVLD